MTGSLLGDGLRLEEDLPASWTAGPLPHDLALARLNADNFQLLAAEASLDELRLHEALKDESPALLHELQRLEFKLNVLLRLTSELAKRYSAQPPPRRVALASRAMEWWGDQALPVGATGVIDLFIHATVPHPLKLPATVVGSRTQDATAITQFKFSGLSDQVVDLIEKLIFRHHRRLVAGARQSSTPRS